MKALVSIIAKCQITGKLKHDSVNALQWTYVDTVSESYGNLEKNISKP